MKCFKCGAELREEMTFCPMCGARQSANQADSGNAWQQQENQQQINQQWVNEQNQQSTNQQWVNEQNQQSVNQQQQYQQQNNGFTPNNPYYGAAYGNSAPVMQEKKKSRTPLIIALAVSVVIIIGLAVTCVVLIASRKSSSNDSNGIANSNAGINIVSKESTAEDTVSEFLDALIAGEYSQASEYVLSGDIDYFEFGDTDLSKSGLKRNYKNLTGYEIVETEDMDRDDVEEVNDYINYKSEITSVSMVGIYFIYDYDDYDDAAVYLVETNDEWYIIGIDN